MAGFGQRGDIGGKLDFIARAQSLAIADEGLPAAQVDPLVQGRADPCLAPAAFQLGGNDARVVEHQHIARAQQAGQIADVMIEQRPGAARHQQQPRRIARPRGAQGDVFRRKVEIEQVNAHGHCP